MHIQYNEEKQQRKEQLNKKVIPPLKLKNWESTGCEKTVNVINVALL